MLAFAKKLLFGVAFLFALSASAGQYPNHAQSTRTTVTVHIVWLRNFHFVNFLCSNLGVKPTRPEYTIVGCYNPKTQTIYAVEPDSFNDAERLEILGHEFWHALGAKHPDN